jgi:transcription elongation factor GreA
MKILTTSPIAKALMGKKVGEKVKVALPRGSMQLEVIEIADHE